MRPEHTEANKLLDIAEQGDREAYREALKELQGRLSKDAYNQVVHLATWQHLMYERYHRLFAWRADWTAERGK